MTITNVFSNTVTTNSLVWTGATHLKAVYIAPGASAGNVTIYDATTATNLKTQLGTTAGGSAVFVQLPGDGTQYKNGVYISVGNASSVTVFCG